MRLALRNAANSFQIEGKGVLPGDPYHGVGVGTRDTPPYIYTYIYIYQILYYYCIFVGTGTKNEKKTIQINFSGGT
jgi:hypothetical protein